MPAALQSVVLEFLNGGALSETELFALRAYLGRYIDRQAEIVAGLKTRLPELREPEDYRRWFADALLNDFDPTA
jgi:hypothetical protein